ncbi:hypothetical protein FNV43_RR00693 [Rhamnella rubrinervis]|uniref:Uncharacterized protein n=1 Tax=Rhamnella rubrinervis TaxID=2594499 RepID=A0A8K0MSN3_9ROSA|nr:hypothetical protein FNV43_RR00693 [Rhamnella rubrinervis]
MVTTSKAIEASDPLNSMYDRASELEAFDEKKAGVKGLVDAGVTQFSKLGKRCASLDLSVFRRFEIVALSRGILVITIVGIRRLVCPRLSSRTWQGVDWRARYVEHFSHRPERSFRRSSSVRKDCKKSKRSVEDLGFLPNSQPCNPFECYGGDERGSGLRDSGGVLQPSNESRNFVVKLLSETLGLEPNHLNNMDCAEGLSLLCHYYPACSQPELTMGTTKKPLLESQNHEEWNCFKDAMVAHRSRINLNEFCKEGSTRAQQPGLRGGLSELGRKACARGPNLLSWVYTRVGCAPLGHEVGLHTRLAHVLELDHAGWAALSAAQVPTPAVTVPVNYIEKPGKFNGLNFKRWQQKMMFYLTTFNLARFLTKGPPKVNEDDRDSLMAFDVWKGSNYLCQNYMMNVPDTA